jgi:hypothetical protein
MKRTKIAAALLCLSMPVAAQAMEFQTPGTLGMGRAGVARTTDAYATFINPAGLAFHEKTFSSKLGLGTGISINSSLAENVDKIGKMDVSALTNLSFSGTSTTQDALSATAQAVEYIGIVNDLDHNKGTLVATPGGMLAFQYSNIGVAAIVSSEMVSFPTTDTTNVRPGDPDVSTMSLFAVGIGATGVTTSGTLFNSTQRTQIEAAFMNNGASASEATAIVNKLEGQLQSSTGNKSGQTSQQLADAMVHMADSFTSGNSIENNATSVVVSGIALAEIPIAYGHKFDLGKFGHVGLGAAFKIMQGTVFYTSKQLVSIDGSTDIFKEVRDNKVDSTTFGVDLGALWRYEDLKSMGPINVGLVVKNINSPQFDTFQAAGSYMPNKLKVKPQARVGVALDPLSWLTLAADLDVTKNKTILPGVDSQNFGGGLEAHFSWISLRAGVYRNIADSANKPVITGGLSLGPQWLRLDVNGAVSTEKTQYDDQSYPREAKVEIGLSTMF